MPVSGVQNLVNGGGFAPIGRRVIWRSGSLLLFSPPTQHKFDMAISIAHLHHPIILALSGARESPYATYMKKTMKRRHVRCFTPYGPVFVVMIRCMVLNFTPHLVLFVASTTWLAIPSLTKGHAW